MLRILPICFHENRKLLEIKKDAKKVQWYLNGSEVRNMNVDRTNDQHMDHGHTGILFQLKST